MNNNEKPQQPSPDDELSPQEELALLRMLTRGNQRLGLKDFTETEAEKVWQWAVGVRRLTALLDLALKGLVDIGIGADGQLVFNAVQNPDLINGYGEAIPPSLNPGDALSPEEELALLRALTRGNQRLGVKDFTETEAEKVWQWAAGVRRLAALLDLALMGLVDIGIRADRELVFNTVHNPGL